MDGYGKRHGVGGRRCDLVLDTAFELFSQRSIEAVSMSDVAEAANIGVATIYRYFGTKRMMVEHAATKQWEDYFRTEGGRLYDQGFPGMSGYERVRALLELIIGLAQKRPELLRFLGNFESYLSHEELTDEDIELVKGTPKRLGEIFKEAMLLGVEQGDIDPKFVEGDRVFYGLTSIFASAKTYVGPDLLLLSGKENYLEPMRYQMETYLSIIKPR